MQGANRSRSGALAAICNLRRAPKSTNFQQSEEFVQRFLKPPPYLFHSIRSQPRPGIRPGHAMCRGNGITYPFI